MRVEFTAPQTVLCAEVKAAILYGKEQVRIDEISPAPLGPGEVRLTIEAALTCGTDLKVFQRGYHARMIQPPATFGHELAGVISDLGAGVTGWRVGQRVVVANSAPCGQCSYCRRGQENLCDDLLFLNGAYAESIVVPARLAQRNMLSLRPNTSFCDAALVEPLACVVHGVQESHLRAGEAVLVIGAGPIGLMFVALAKKLGCNVLVAGRRAPRLEAARRLGAAQVVDVTEAPDIVAAIEREAGRCDVVIEAVGKPETWAAALKLVRKGGRVNLFGGCPAGATVQLDTAVMHYQNLTLLSSFHHTPRSVRRALNFIERGVVRAAEFVDGECPLSQLPELLRSMAAGNHAVKTFIRVKE
jgi:L-iditol 2-dehydrogenase